MTQGQFLSGVDMSLNKETKPNLVGTFRYDVSTSLIGPYQVLPLQVRVNLGVMAIKEYFIFPKAPGLEPHHLMI